jgi:hypothetical protein
VSLNPLQVKIKNGCDIVTYIVTNIFYCYGHIVLCKIMMCITTNIRMEAIYTDFVAKGVISLSQISIIIYLVIFIKNM